VAHEPGRLEVDGALEDGVTGVEGLEVRDRGVDQVGPVDDVAGARCKAVELVAVDGDRDEAHLRQRLLEVVVVAEIAGIARVVVAVGHEDHRNRAALAPALVERLAGPVVLGRIKDIAAHVQRVAADGDSPAVVVGGTHGEEVKP
jgi:hypothetical protein